MPCHAMPYHSVRWSSPDDEPQGARSQGPAKDQAEKRETEETDTTMLRAPRYKIVDPVEIKVTSTNITIYRFREKNDWRRPFL